MTPAHLSALWRDLAPGMGNHLWQSTLFAVAAGVLTLILRGQHARFRCWIWLAASVKFLTPFSLLVRLGSLLAWSRSSATATPGLYFTIGEIGQPFTQSSMPGIPVAAPSIGSPSVLHSLPSVLIATWLCGFVAVLLLWCVRWRLVSRAVRESLPLREGREVEALRRQERVAGIRKPIEIVLSQASLEPGIFGIARPVLIWPEGISKHLEDAHLEAIIAHEVWHVRRRDNLAAAIHMIVEGMFWFHPLVWWLGARLVDERERACDEEVLRFGSERQVYAESILKVCEFCVGSPLACVSGVTGSDLKKRMVYIMTERIARKLDFTKKLLLSAAVFLAIALPIGFGVVTATQVPAQAQADSAVAAATAYHSVVPDTTYQSASIRLHQPGNGVDEHVGVMFSPRGFSARGATLQTIFQTAYGVQPDRISGAPDWVNSQKYDVDVTLPDSAVQNPPKPDGGIGIERVQTVLQALLADRLKLTLHRETRDLSIYELVVAEDGPKLQEAKPGEMASVRIPAPPQAAGQTVNVQIAQLSKIVPDRPLGMGMMQMGPGELIDHGTNLRPLVEQLSWQLGHTVVDKTGLKGNYDFTLRWTPGESEAGMRDLMGSKPAADSSAPASGPSIFTAIQEQLGLKLEPRTAPMDVLVIDHVEAPSEN